VNPFSEIDGNLECRFMGEVLRISPWGPDALRVRARPGVSLVAPHVDALLPVQGQPASIRIGETRATITRGRLTAEITLTTRHGADIRREAVIRFLRADTGAELLAETRSHFAGPRTRNFKALASGAWRLEQQFRAYDDEALWGMGQPQHGAMNLKGVSTTLLQQNAHAVIPFVISSRGYGLLWNNPCDRPRRIRPQRHPLDGRSDERTRLLDLRGRQPGRDPPRLS
jgi:alpha-D-xyloside xylohydrolase